MGGKRDLIANHPNYLWFTPDSVGEQAWNGFCAEYCGASHANMKFRAFTVTPAQFEAWAAHQASPAVFGAVAPAAPAGAAAPGAAPAGAQGAGAAGTPTDTTRGPASSAAQQAQVAAGTSGTTGPGSTVQAPNSAQAAGGANRPDGQNAAAPAAATVRQAGYVQFPAEKLPAHVIPRTPVPAALRYNDALVGDAERGRALVSAGQGGCIGCHMISGNPMAMGVIGPNLTHVGSRSTIAGGLFPNDTRHLARWIKNARAMKPGVQMFTLGKGEYDPVTKATVPMGLTDEQIADIVAYMQALK
jgi:cytochrome c oxidase subunit 2